VLRRGYIDSAGGAATTSLASDTIMELADKTILMSKFCTSSRVGGEEDDTGEVEAELEHNGVSGVGRVG